MDRAYRETARNRKMNQIGTYHNMTIGQAYYNLNKSANFEGAFESRDLMGGSERKPRNTMQFKSKTGFKAGNENTSNGESFNTNTQNQNFPTGFNIAPPKIWQSQYNN
mmetsp:Transcript_11664/g.19695  ORF Transcript_11664/g.19695 Transcript_11664/m.19695 type:complete len:108 (-) Transcript_11664:26-349(-)